MEPAKHFSPEGKAESNPIWNWNSYAKTVLATKTSLIWLFLTAAPPLKVFFFPDDSSVFRTETPRLNNHLQLLLSRRSFSCSFYHLIISRRRRNQISNLRTFPEHFKQYSLTKKKPENKRFKLASPSFILRQFPGAWIVRDLIHDCSSLSPVEQSGCFFVIIGGDDGDGGKGSIKQLP